VRPIALALVAAALAAPAALAKGPDGARACGAHRCTSIRGSSVGALFDRSGRPGFEQLAAPRRVPYYRVTLYERGKAVWQFLYAPSVSRVRITELGVYPFGPVAPYWRAVTSAGRAVFGRVVGGLVPFAAPRGWR
jgi:hypothetical protein